MKGEFIGTYGGLVIEEEVFEAEEEKETESEKKGKLVIDEQLYNGTEEGATATAAKAIPDEGQESPKLTTEYRSSHAFYLNAGAHAVVLDGSRGPHNAVTEINHSCQPNARLREAWIDGQWHILCEAIEDINKGDEISCDYELTTDDPDDPRLAIPCVCGTIDCIGTLWKFRA